MDEKSPWWTAAIKYGIIIIIAYLIMGFVKPNKYEGQTAEEWFNDYDWLVACIEEHPQTAADNCI